MLEDLKERNLLEEAACALGVVNPYNFRIIDNLRKEVLKQRANEKAIMESRKKHNLNMIAQNKLSSSSSRGYLPSNFGPDPEKHRDQNENNERRDFEYVKRLVANNLAIKNVGLGYDAENVRQALQLMSNSGDWSGTGTHCRVHELEKFCQKSIDRRNNESTMEKSKKGKIIFVPPIDMILVFKYDFKYDFKPLLIGTQLLTLI